MILIPLFPLNTVLYPDGHLPLQVFEVRYLDMIRRCIDDGSQFGVVPLLAGAEVRTPDMHELLAGAGSLARIEAWSAPVPGLLQVRCAGAARFRICNSERLRHGLWQAEVETLAPDQALPVPPDQQNVADALGALISRLQQENLGAAQMPLQPPFRLDECGWVANRWCELLTLDVEQKVRLLEQDSPVLRLELIQDLLYEHGLLE